MYNYNEYFGLVDDLVTKVDDSSASGENVEFNCVIGLLRGGYIPAEALSRSLDIPLVLTKITSYNNRIQGNMIISEIINERYIKGNVLVVDDLIDSGNTLKFFIEYLKENYDIDSIKTAVMWNKDVERDIEPDFFSIRVPKEEWIKLPLEKYGGD